MVNTRCVAVLAAAFVCASATRSAAQPPSPPAGPAPAQLVVERIEHGWMIAPDARAADLDGRVGSLVGVYGGHITDRRWLVGAGGYWLTNRDRDFTMGYGGAVVEWMARSDRLVGFGVRTLIGGGSATMPITVGELLGGEGRVTSRTVRFGSRHRIDEEQSIAARDDFFIAEPQLNLLWNVTRRYRFSAGVGYRLVGAAPVLGDRLEGISGSVAFHIGGW